MVGTKQRPTGYQDDDSSMVEIRSKDRHIKWDSDPVSEANESPSLIDQIVLESGREGRTACVQRLLRVLKTRANKEDEDDSTSIRSRMGNMEEGSTQRQEAPNSDGLEGFTMRIVDPDRSNGFSPQTELLDEVDNDDLETLESSLIRGGLEVSRWSLWTEDQDQDTSEQREFWKRITRGFKKS